MNNFSLSEKEEYFNSFSLYIKDEWNAKCSIWNIKESN